MRKLIVIEDDVIVRNFVTSGALDPLDDAETFYLARPEVTLTEPLAAKGERYLGIVQQPRERADEYHFAREVLLTSYRRHSRSQRVRLREYRPLKRWRWYLRAAPGIRHLLLRRAFRRTGLHPELEPLMRELAPDILIAPSDGIGTVATDAYRLARELGIPSLAVVYGWDHLAYKGGYPIKPDHLAVPGAQSEELAVTTHGFDPAIVTHIGSPYIDDHIHHATGSEPSPFPFRYALFAGGSFKLDERGPIHALDRAIEEEGLDLKLVYRPHPHRIPRDVPDFVDETELRHVVIDPQVRDRYLAHFGRAPAEEGSASRLPELDYYAALLDNAEFVLSPYSTMMIEAALFERKVIVISFDDGIHKELKLSQLVADHDLLQGLDAIDGFRVCTRAEDISHAFKEFARDPASPGTLREQMKYFMYFDERTYGERLADLVNRIAAGDGAPARAADPAPSAAG